MGYMGILPETPNSERKPWNHESSMICRKVSTSHNNSILAAWKKLESQFQCVRIVVVFIPCSLLLP